MLAFVFRPPYPSPGPQSCDHVCAFPCRRFSLTFLWHFLRVKRAPVVAIWRPLSPHKSSTLSVCFGASFGKRDICVASLHFGFRVKFSCVSSVGRRASVVEAGSLAYCSIVLSNAASCCCYFCVPVDFFRLLLVSFFFCLFVAETKCRFVVGCPIID